MHYCNHNVHNCCAVFIWAKTENIFENKVCHKRNKKSIILLMLGGGNKKFHIWELECGIWCRL